MTEKERAKARDGRRNARRFGLVHPHETLHHEEGRTIDEIAADDWANLLAHADAIGFFTRPDPPLPAPDARIFHLTITSGERSRELSVNDPFESPELALLIRLTHHGGGCFGTCYAGATVLQRAIG